MINLITKKGCLSVVVAEQEEEKDSFFKHIAHDLFESQKDVFIFSQIENVSELEEKMKSEENEIHTYIIENGASILDEDVQKIRSLAEKNQINLIVGLEDERFAFMLDASFIVKLKGPALEVLKSRY